uniref:Uncharacterized protein n=1 Tax=Trypanosoma vivax (strain Y486) TaxID=1055687 RepID=G0U1S7_TRYVY|nr:hypothetical protein, unlikely [Trypanosoma vivax Y486]
MNNNSKQVGEEQKRQWYDTNQINYENCAALCVCLCASRHNNTSHIRVRNERQMKPMGTHKVACEKYVTSFMFLPPIQLRAQNTLPTEPYLPQQTNGVSALFSPQFFCFFSISLFQKKGWGHTHMYIYNEHCCCDINFLSRTRAMYLLKMEGRSFPPQNNTK